MWTGNNLADLTMKAYPKTSKWDVPPVWAIDASPLHTPTLLHPLPLFYGGGPWWGWGWGSPVGQGGACCWPSLDVAAAAGAPLGVCAVGLRRQGLVQGVEAGVGGQGISPRRHPLVDTIQTLRLFEAGDLVLGREAFDGCWDARKKRRRRGEIRTDFREGEIKQLKEWGHACSHSPTHHQIWLIFRLILVHRIVATKLQLHPWKMRNCKACRHYL